MFKEELSHDLLKQQVDARFTWVPGLVLKFCELADNTVEIPCRSTSFSHLSYRATTQKDQHIEWPLEHNQE